jgi:hypothetical protein
MDPEKKARELVDKFWGLNPIYEVGTGNPDYEMAKRSALVTVDEIISACEYNNVEGWNTDWWNKVKLEIEKI